MKIFTGSLAALSLAATLAFTGSAHAANTADQDKKFVADSGEGSLAEIEMAKLALANSTNKDVRMFAEKMIHDHQTLITNMKPFATKMDVPPPTKDALPTDAKDEYQRLSGKKGEEFDKDYINTAILDHQKDLSDFKKEYDSTDNAQLKATVGKGEKVIQGHYDMIEGIAKKYNLPTHS